MGCARAYVAAGNKVIIRLTQSSWAGARTELGKNETIDENETRDKEREEN